MWKKLISLSVVLVLIIGLSVSAATYPGQLGINLGGNSDAGGIFVDMAKEHHRYSRLPSGTMAYDSAGWPACDARLVMDFRLVAEWEGYIDDPEEYRHDNTGTYSCSFTGQADLAVTGAAIQNQSYNSGTNTTTFDFVITQRRVFSYIDFSNTQRTAGSGTDTGFTELKMIKPGYPAETTQVFTDDFINCLTSASFGVIRFMSMTAVNDQEPTYPGITSWSQRKLTTDAAQVPIGDIGKLQAAAWEYVIDVANMTGMDPWVNIPVSATTDYVTQLATMLKNNVDVSLRIYVESSNEVWNCAPGFNQCQYNQAQASALGIGEQENHVRRTVELAQIFESVFGAGSLNNRVCVVLCSHAPMVKWWVEPMLQYISSNFGAPSNYIYSIARQTYFSTDGSYGTVDEILDRCHDDATNQISEIGGGDSGRLQWVEKASAWGLAGGASSYEGGFHVPAGGGLTNLDTQITMHRVARAGTELKYNYDDCFFALGANIACQFTMHSSYHRHGCWGLTDDLSNPDRNYKFQACRDLLGEPVPPGQATNPSPADGAVDVSVAVDLSWTAGSGATSHDVYFGTSSPGDFQGNQPGTTFDPGTLANDVTYYWRIDEKNAVGTTTGVVWSFTTEAATPPPGQASNPSPADGATDVGIDTDLSWTAGAGATSHDVYFGTVSPGDFQGNQPGTTFDPGTLEYDTTYYWRIDEKNVAGTTTGVVWSFTTGSPPTADANIVETTTAPTIDGTVDGVWADAPSYSIATVISGTVSSDTDLSGTWQALWDSSNLYYLVQITDEILMNDSANAWDDDSVELYIDADNSKGTSYDGVNDFQYVFRWNDGAIHLGTNSVTNTTGITFAMVATAGGYNFEVLIPWSTLGVTPAQGNLIGTDVHLNDDDDGGSRDGKKAWFATVDNSWTDPSTFGTAELVAGGAPQPPGQASNPNPGDGATSVSVDADLSWTAGAGADSHDVYFGTVTEPPFVGNQTETTYEPGTMAEVTTYFWRIDEVNAAGTTTGVVWSFTTAAAPQPPGQASNPNPGDGATSVSVDADLSWTAGAGADSHDVYFGTTSPGDFQGNQPGTTFDPGPLANDVTYYWRIDEVNAAGTTTGVVWSFTTVAAPPGQASNPSPADGASAIDVDADLSWTAGTGATSHDVYFGTVTTPPFVGNQTETTYDPGTMAEVTTYFWRIDEVNAGGTTEGVVWSFTTAAGPQPPGQATNPNPGDGATGVSVDADLSWTAGAGADSHDIYFGTDSTPDSGEFQGNQPGTTFDPGTLANDTTYYWRIDEVNANGTTTGVVWSFTTESAPQPPGQATNPSPADGATGVNRNVVILSWTAGTGATSHDVYFGTNPTPGAGEFQGNQTPTTFDPGRQAKATWYYWRIDEVNASGTTTGVVWSFQTK